MPRFENLENREVIILTTPLDSCADKEGFVSFDYVNKVVAEINEAGYKCSILEVESSSDLKKKLAKLNPQKVVFLNWIEEIDNLPYGFHIAPQILDDLGFMYTGNDAKILLDSCDKIKIKKLLVDGGISTPKYIVIYPESHDVSAWNTYPCIVKPAYEHCSFGITHSSVVDSEAKLKSRAAYLFGRFKQPLVVEEFIDGQEYFVSAWGGSSPEILPPVCQNYLYTSDYHYQIYDFDTKWNKKSKYYYEYGSHRIVRMVSEVSERIQTEVLKALRYTGCQGYSRIDLRVQNEIPYIIDVNPNPDITPTSDFVTAAARLGYSYGETILKLCDLAIL